MVQFKNIGLIGRLGSKSVIDTLKQLIHFIESRKLSVVIDEKVSDLMPGHGHQVATSKMMGEICDLVIVVGGDGSLLGAARLLAMSNVPVLGINRGKLGFLTDVKPAEIEEKVADVLEGRYTVDNRFLLDVVVRRDGEPIAETTALNDCVLHPGKATRIIEFELWIEGQYVYNQRSDGLIISTPTGSTAYALSAGGPLMQPKLDALVLVPMFPHTLSSRPIVVEGNSQLKLVISQSNETYPAISCDGQLNIALAPGDTVTIQKKPQTLKLLHTLDYDFYRTCREKLGWSSKPGGRQ